MMKSFFTTLSYIFHPLFLPLVGLYFLFSTPAITPDIVDKTLYNNTWEVKQAIYLVFATLMLIAPGISVLIMYFSKVISSLTMEDRKERLHVITIVLLYAVFCYVFLRINILPNANYSLLYLLPYTFGVLLVILACLILTYFTKVSLHAAGIFGLIGAVIGYFNTQMNYNLPFILILIFVGGLICAGRLYLKAHSNKDIFIGIVTGFSIEFLCMKFEWFI
ncbi:MAG: phosphatase PAP2 family protein [Crocinitomicaceae bacterium]